MRARAALLIFIIGGCDSGGIPSTLVPYVEAHYTLDRLGGTRALTRIGTLSQDPDDGDHWGLCTSSAGGETKVIDVLVADMDSWPEPEWMLGFEALEWPEGSTEPVRCAHVSILEQGMGNESIGCSATGDGSCRVQVARGDGEHTLVVQFECLGFDATPSSGGTPTTMSVRSGSLEILNCKDF